MGRAGRPGDQRWYEHLRRTRPQRPASATIRNHERRTHRGRVGNRRVGLAGRKRDREGTAGAGHVVVGRHRARQSVARRGGQSRSLPTQALPPLAKSKPNRAARPVWPSRRRVIRQRNTTGTAAHFRILARGRQRHHHAHVCQRRRADRVDGRRHPAGGTERSAATPVQLLQTTLRTSDEPGDRSDSRKTRHEPDHLSRTHGQCAGRDTATRADAQARLADPRQRRPEANSHDGARGVPERDTVDDLPRARRRRGNGPGARSTLQRCSRCGQWGQGSRDPLRPRRVARGGTDPVTPSHSRRRWTPHPSRPSQASEHRHRVRRAARGAALRPLVRIRCDGGEPVPRSGNGGRPSRKWSGRMRALVARRGGKLHRLDRQRPAEDFLENGHQHAAKLSRRADIRSARSIRGVRE